MSSEDEMAACFSGGELSSRRFGHHLPSHLAAAVQTEQLLTHPDLSDPGANLARCALPIPQDCRAGWTPSCRSVPAPGMTV
ncbi:hypothetical protein ACFV4P_23425 [Kitasatospora sp. NPDC059795]|uniref:hypothetical protein n=1 Tax=Kitasatospora sp. NPDC059795 TaxID=3346949 RepID=UPI003650BC2E